MGNCFKKAEKRDKDDNDRADTTEEPTKNAFASDLLKAQNKYRVEHGAEPLKMDENMCKEAQRWAEELARKGGLEHSKTDHGENLSFVSPHLDGEKAASMWYNEIKDYDFRNPGFKGNTGHFTQVVWKGSKLFGTGIAKGSNGGFYAVGRYSPPGNITNAGQFEENVQPAR